MHYIIIYNNPIKLSAYKNETLTFIHISEGKKHIAKDNQKKDLKNH